jgi:glycine cleavage system transcriptional repressor
MKKPHFVISAIGPDSPGIVAATTKALFQLDSNVESSMMTILGGHFAMMIVVATERSQQQIEDALTPVLGILSVNPIDGYGERGSRDGTHRITVLTEADRPGVMYAVSRTLAELDVNIVGLNSEVDHTTVTACGISFAVALPDGVSDSHIKEALEAALADGHSGEKDWTVEVGPQPNVR